MHYNTRVIQYPNGEIQLRKYSTPMYIDDSFEDDHVFNNLMNQLSRLSMCFQTTPFSDDFAEIIFEDDIIEGIENIEERKLKSKFRSANRTKQAVYMYARCVNWEWFVTLTFNPEKVDRYNYDECSTKARQWLSNQKKRYAPDLKYLMVPEQHKDGAWHFHLLMADTGSMKFINSGKRSKGDIIYNMVKWQFGFTTATKIKDVHKVAKYIGKYITKQLADATPNRQRYFVSNHIELPKQSLFFAEDEKALGEIIQAITDEGYQLQHTSSNFKDGNYTNVSYMEFCS